MSNGTLVRSKTVVIGLDGATFDLIGPWLDQGELPCLKRLMDEGCSGILNSVFPPVSPVAWTSFMTGVNPAKHGILDFIEPMHGGDVGVKLNTRMDCRAKPIWRTLNEQGYKTTVINIPMTFPPDKLDGIMISGMDAPGLDSEFTYPADLKDELIRELGKYIIDIESAGKAVVSTDDYLRSLYEMIENRVKTVDYLLEKKPWDFFMVVFMASDRAQHTLWRFMDPTHPKYTKEKGEKFQGAMLDVFRKLDEAVGHIVESLPEDTNIVIMSDHGFGAVHKTLSLNKWLMDRGYLVLKPEARLSKGLSRAASLSTDLVRVIARKLGVHPQTRLRFFDPVDWSRTKAFFIGTAGKIFICEKGRYSKDGVEPGEEYEKLRDKMAEELLELKDSVTGDLVVEQVLKREDIYEGPSLSNAPDLMVVLKLHYTCLVKMAALRRGIGTQSQELLSPHKRWSGDHQPEGIFIIKSPLVKRNLKNLNKSIMDICPTIFYMMDAPVSETIDGEVMTDLFVDEVIQERSVRYVADDEGGKSKDGQSGYSNEEKRKIEERLKGLGYLE